MDPFSQSSPRFVDLLASQSSPQVHVDSGEAPVSEPVVVSGKEKVERKRWAPKEDIVLISAWLNTSKDPIVGNEQKLTSFWRRIEAYMHASPLLVGFIPREWSQCKQRWGRMSAEVSRFVGCHETALKEQRSGQSENDVMKLAHEIYVNDYGTKCVVEHCWRELRFEQKWRSTCLPKEKKKEGCPEVVAVEEEERPPGVKASKAAKRRKPNQEKFDQIQTILDNKNTLSNKKILDRLLGRNPDTLSEHEVALKNKLISEML